jgi:hypothetical protein
LRFIFTTEEKKVARKGIDGYRQSYIIDCREFVLEFEYEGTTEVDSAQDFIVNKEIEKKLSQAAGNKKTGQVIYFNYKLTPELILNVKDFFASKGVTADYILFDPTGTYDKSVKRLVNKTIK